jgi:hypothetical protein
MSSITYRIINDGGKWLLSRPWHVEANVGNGWSRCAVCLSKEDAESYIRLCSEPAQEDEAMMLGNFSS